MEEEKTIYEKHYSDYVRQLQEVAFATLGERLGGESDAERLVVPMFDATFTVSRNGIADTDGRVPDYDICVVLCKYVLRCPTVAPLAQDWVGFRDFKDAAPLIHYFSNAVEAAAASRFTDQMDRLHAAARRIGGFAPDMDLTYDAAYQFNALPKVPLVLLCNDADAQFPASCSILFERRAEVFLDAECLAMLGHRLVRLLKKSM